MPDYQNGKVYRISAGDLTYYGSTTQALHKRMKGHRGDFKSGKEIIASFAVLQQDPDAKIVLVENYPCNSKEELNAREQYYIENNQCVNKNRSFTGMTKVEYDSSRYMENRDFNLQKSKDYHEANRDEILQKNKGLKSLKRLQAKL